MDFKTSIEIHLRESARTKERILEKCSPDISDIVHCIVKSFRGGHKLLICGNGGSAADAQHIAAEFVVRLNHEINRPALPAIALSTDTSILTAGGNDIGFDNVFARQVEGLGSNGDIFLGISTSGNSENILRALEMAKSREMVTIGFLGSDGGRAADKFDHRILIPSANTQHIQEGHITVGHIVCDLVEKSLFS